MPDHRRAKCKNCKRHRDDCGPLSWRGYCGVCGPLICERANDEQHEHRGPTFAKWRRAMAASVGGVLLDEVEAEP